MITRFVAVFAAAAAFAGPAADAQSDAAAEPSVRELTDVVWEKLPGARDIRGVYPQKAARLERNGRSVIRCKVAENRRLTDCEVLGENPEDLGFGEAHVKLVKMFRIAPATRSGEPTVGGYVVHKMTWTIR